MRYRDLLQVEDLFRRGKALMRTRPVFHSSDAAIRGHVFCTFLALVMQKHLDDLAREAGAVPDGEYCCAIWTGSSRHAFSTTVKTGWCAPMQPRP